jgi:hypothetical protein
LLKRLGFIEQTVMNFTNTRPCSCNTTAVGSEAFMGITNTIAACTGEGSGANITPTHVFCDTWFK